jgi:hypothetical protein
MNNLSLFPAIVPTMIDTTAKTPSRFIESNTREMDILNLRRDCIIPVFSKDNESTICHTQFIEAMVSAVTGFFRHDAVLRPAVRVSHPIKGRIPEAMGKPAHLLRPEEITTYFERMAFLVEIPTIQTLVNNNTLSLVVGGVRAYNHENLFGKKSMEKFRIFIGFRNVVCTNLCISTDGCKGEIRVSDPEQIESAAIELFNRFDSDRMLANLRKLGNHYLNDRQFAQFIGRLRMYPYLPPDEQKQIPELFLTDAQINQVVKGLYQNPDHGGQGGSISLWNLYNLFTDAVKSSYIDSFLDRNLNATNFSLMLQDVLENAGTCWYLN